MMTAPKPEKIPQELKHLNDVRIDPYYWLRDKTNERVLAHLRAENVYADAVMSGTKALQETLYKEMRSRIKEEDQSVPYLKGQYFYYSKTLKNLEYPIYCRKKKQLQANEEVILDVNQLAKDKDYINVRPLIMHPNEQLGAYAVDTKGNRIYTIYFKDLSTGQTLPSTIAAVTGNMAWAEAGNILFYTKHDPKTLRSHQVYRYDLDTQSSELIYEESDERYDVYVYKTLSRKFIFIGSSSKTTDEFRFVPANQPKTSFQLFRQRQEKMEYKVFDGEDGFYILTNWKAENFRLMKTGFSQIERKFWQEVVPHRKTVYLENVEVFKSHIVLAERSKGLTQIIIYQPTTNKKVAIEFPDPAYTVSTIQNVEYESNTVRYQFESLNRPSSVFDYLIKEKKSILLKETEVPGFDSKNYQSERLFAKAKDGTKIPISLVYKKGFQPQAKNPLYLTGYGSYGMSYDPEFHSNVISLLDRGFVFAIAHIRGGSEMGRSWYESGKFLKKKNTFSDFIACADHLVKQKYVNPNKLYATGGSAGGLLMGAVMNLRPQLFHGIVADVPFVDVLTTMLDTSLPLTTQEYEEWGDPNKMKFYKYMKSYSPYDNVKMAVYPNILATSGLNDSQVPYWEPAKWVLKLREMQKDPTRRVLFKIEMEVGHGGKSGRFEHLKMRAFAYAFILSLEQGLL